MASLLLIAESKKALMFETLLAQLRYSFRTISPDDIMAAKTPFPRSTIDGVVLIAPENASPITQMVERIAQLTGNAPAVVVTPPGHAQMAMEAIAAGVHDFLYLPVAAERLQVSLRNALQAKPVVRPPVRAPEAGFGEFVGTSDALMYVLLKARALALGRGHLMLYGERGVGKTMMARAMHRASGQDSPPLQLHDVRHMAEIALILREAPRDATICLNLAEPEASETMSDKTAADVVGLAREKSLRLILGQSLPRRAGPAHLPATPFHTALDAAPLFISALRDRRIDIAAQCEHFLSCNAQSLQRMALVPTAQAARLIAEHEWPGNTKQLMHVMYQAYLITDGARLTVNHLEELLRTDATPAPMAAREFAILPFDQRGQVKRLDDIEAELMTLAFQHYQGSRSEVARRLGIGRTTLYRKMRQIGLD